MVKKKIKTKKKKQEEKIENRYDKTLKELLDNKTLMRELITGFINEPWVKNIDFRTLKKEKTDFLSDDLKEFRNDLLWSIKFKKQKLYFYIHIEFQSTPDRTMPFRFLIYDSLLHIDILENRNKKNKADKLPFIFPILFYIGDNTWNYEFDLTKLIEQPFKDSINYIPKFDIYKIMLNEKSLKDLKIIDNLLSNVLATDNKDINQEALDEIIKKIKQILSGYDKEKELIMLDKINKFIKLISSDKIDIKKALKTLNEEDKMGGMMKMINEIERKSMEKGMVKGIEKGIEKARIETAIEMLKLGAELVFVSKASKLSIEKVKELQKELHHLK
jgi:predicted transposase/invertase (TIGR01784 family)